VQVKEDRKNNTVELVTLINKGWKKAERRGLWKLIGLILHHLTTVCLLWQNPLFLGLLLNYIILSALSCPVLRLKIPPSTNKSLSSLMGNFKEIQCHTVLQQNYNLEHTTGICICVYNTHKKKIQTIY